MNEKQAAECIYTMAASTGYTPREVMNAVVLLTPHMQAAWEIVKVVANENTTYYDGYDDQCCVFCHGEEDYSTGGHESYKHEPDCIVLKARALVKEHSS